MRRKSNCTRRLLCEALEPRAMLSGTISYGSILASRLDPFHVGAGAVGPASPVAAPTPSNPLAAVNVGIGLQAQAAAAANAFLTQTNNASPLKSTTIGSSNPFASPPRGLASPFEIGPASPVTSTVIPTTNTLSPLVNAVSSLTNTLNAITSSSTSSGLGNSFDTASSTLNVLTNTLNALDNATLFSEIGSFVGGATVIFQINPGISTSATPIVPSSSGIFTGGTPFAQANSDVNATVAIVLGTVLRAQTAVDNAIAQSTGPVAPLVGQVLGSSQSLVDNLMLQSSIFQ